MLQLQIVSVYKFRVNKFARVGGVLDAVAYPLEEPTEFVGWRLGPDLLDGWVMVVDEVSVFDELSGVLAHYSKRRDEHGTGEASAGKLLGLGVCRVDLRRYSEGGLEGCERCSRTRARRYWRYGRCGFRFRARPRRN